MIHENLSHAYHAWATNEAYATNHGYRLKSTKQIAPWSKDVEKVYGKDSSEQFHKDATEWAKGKQLESTHSLDYLNDDRRLVAKNADARRSNKITVLPSDKRVARWKHDPGSMDVLGVDNPPSVKKASVMPSRRVPRITPRMGRLR